MRVLPLLGCLIGLTGSCAVGTHPPDERDAAVDARINAGDMAQPMAPCRAAQGLTGTPLSGLCVDFENYSVGDLRTWYLRSQTSACSFGWAVSVRGFVHALGPSNYTPTAGTNVGCGFRLRDLTPSEWSQKQKLRITIEHEYWPGQPSANSFAVIELIGALRQVLFYPTSTQSGPSNRAVFDVDVALLPPAVNIPIEFRLWQTTNLTQAPTWEIRSLAVLVE